MEQDYSEGGKGIWIDEIKMLMDKIEVCCDKTCKAIYDIALKENRYDLLEKCLKKWGKLINVNLLLLNNKDINSIDRVMKIAEKYNQEKVNWIAQSDALYHLIYHECISGDQQTVEFLIRHGADINRYGDTSVPISGPYEKGKGNFFITPLHRAIDWNRIEDIRYDIVKLLLENGADPNAGALPAPESLSWLWKGITPLGTLSTAISETKYSEKILKAIEITELLVKYGAKAKCRSLNSPTFFLDLLSLYAKNKRGFETTESRQIQEKLLSLFELICQNEGVECNPLIAEYIFDKEVVEILIKHGLDINGNFGSGRTFLHHCVFKNEELIEFLVNKGADVNAKDFGGQPLLLYVLNIRDADSHDSTEDNLAMKVTRACRTLIKYGADEMVVDENGNTAMSLLEHWEKNEERAIDEQYARSNAMEEAYGQSQYDRTSNVLWRELERRHRGDEDSMQSDPDYWSLMESYDCEDEKSFPFK